MLLGQKNLYFMSQRRQRRKTATRRNKELIAKESKGIGCGPQEYQYP